MTSKALGFLWPAVFRTVISHINGQDNTSGSPPGDKNPFHDNKRHFTNCLFSDSVSHINGRYRAIMDALDVQRGEPNTVLALQNWGELIHPIQDFYSHSVWVDPEGLNAEHRLLDSSLGLWSLPGPYNKLFGDVVIVEGHPPNINIDLPRDKDGKPTSAVPIVRKTQYSHSLDGFSVFFDKTYRGLMTASGKPFQDQMKCPGYDPQKSDADQCIDDASVCIRHGDSDCGGPFHHNCLHHDQPTSNWTIAFDAATRQTRHEWCRLLHLANAADAIGPETVRGMRVSMLIAVWSLGFPHPVGTPCESETGQHKVEVRTGEINLDQIADPNERPNVFSFAIYNSNLKNSQRFIGTGLPDEPLQICVNDGDEVVATLWGWSKLQLQAEPSIEDIFFRPFSRVTRGARVGRLEESLPDGEPQPTGLVGNFGLRAGFEFRMTRDAPECRQ